MSHPLMITFSFLSLLICISRFSTDCMGQSPNRDAPQESVPENTRPDRLASQFRNAAQAIQGKLAELQVRSCRFGNITPRSGNSEFGKRFITQVEPELRRQAIEISPETGTDVNAGSTIIIAGTFLVMVPDDDQPEVVFQLDFTRPGQVRPISVLDVKIVFFSEESGDDLPDTSAAPQDTTDQQAEEALFAAGITTTCTPDSSLVNRRKIIAQLVRDSRDRTQISELTYVNPEGRKVTEPVACVEGGLGYAVQIRSQNSPLPHAVIRAPLNDRPIGFVPLNEKQTYIVRLINPLPFDAVARMEIDGVDVFHFATERPAPQFFLIPAGGAIDVPGWMNNRDSSHEFQITTFEDSARAKAGLEPPGDGLGMISVAFRYAWIQDPPQDEGSARSGTQGGTDLPQLTGLGALVEQRYESVSRHTGFQSDILHLRYGKSREATEKANAAVVKILSVGGNPSR